MVQAVLVGCGSMSKVWLEAARQTEGVTIAGLVDLDRSRAEARAKEFGLGGIAIGSRPRCRSRRDQAGCRLRRRGAGGAARCGVRRVRPWLSPSDRKAARRQPRARAGDCRRRRAGQPAPCRRAEPPLPRQRPAHPALSRFRRDWRADQHPLPTSSSRRISAGSARRCDHVLLLDMAIHTFDAARYMVNGEPQSVYCQEWEPKNSWYAAGFVGDARCSIWAAASSSPIAAAGAPTGSAQAGKSGWRIVGEQGSLVWDGFDDLRAEADRRRCGTASSTKSSRSPFHRSIRATASAAISASCRTSSPRSRTAASPRRRGTDNIKSLAMVLGAIESAETGRRVPITI